MSSLNILRKSISALSPTTIFVAQNDRNCLLGDSCPSYAKCIGLSLDDILRYEIEQNNTLILEHSSSLQISAALTMAMFLAGLFNSGLSFITFGNSETRQLDAGYYLLPLSITSFLTICLFTFNFWFYVLTHKDYTVTGRSVLHAGCVTIEPALKLLSYFDS